MNNIRIFSTTETLMNTLAEDICAVAAKAIAGQGFFNFVLSGGSSPKKLYELLASDAYKDKIDWQHVYFFFGDERFLPSTDDERNSVMIEKALFNPLKIKKSNIFAVDTTFSPEVAAQKYWDSIVKHFKGQPVAFDFILLGLGDNAHTASLFPNTAVLAETAETVKSVFIDELDMYRITMTAPLINKAHQITFLVYGKAKAEAVHQILENKEGKREIYPAKLIQQIDGEIDWFLDDQAASLLGKK